MKTNQFFMLNRFFLFIGLFSFFISCGKKEIWSDYVPIPTHCTFLYVNEEGENLCDPKTGYLEPEKIKVFNEVDGKLIDVYGSVIYSHGSFKVIQNESSGEYLFQLQINTKDAGNITTTILDFGNGDKYIIEAEVRKTENIRPKVLTWNGKPVEYIDWSETGEYPYDFIIVKKD